MGLDIDWYRLSDDEMAMASLDWSHPNLTGISLDLLKDKGWARLNLPGPDEYAPHAHGNFPTPSGKVELRSSLAEQVGSIVLPVFREGSNEFQVGGTVDPLPHYVAPDEDADGSPYPLYFLSPKAHAFLNSQYGNANRQRRVQGDEQWVLINSGDAEQRGVDDGDEVRIFNEHGEIHAVARVGTHGDVAAGVVICPLGHWVKTIAGATPNRITRRPFTDLGNGPTFSDTRVDVAPLTGLT
jgi:anaerobic selenocysteine-containing dehydrogenase